MNTSVQESPELPTGAALPRWATPRSITLGALVLLALYLSWRIVEPFLAGLSWAFALAVIVDPVYQKLRSRTRYPNALAAAAVVVITIVVIGPVILLLTTIAREAVDAVTRLTSETALRQIGEGLEKGGLLGDLLRRFGAQFDIAGALAQLAQAAARWASSVVSATITGSMWMLTQIGVTLFALFYFLRDGEDIVSRAGQALPLRPPEIEVLFFRVSQMIRVSLGGKLVVSAIQGGLGGSIFYWLGLPAPVFWGFVMGVLSLFPVIGAFLIWAPVASVFALQGDWKSALILVGWGVVVVNPVDNLLGPVLVGTKLQMHTLLTFFTVIGGLAAFGPAGLVLGPVTVAVAVTLAERAEFMHLREP